MKKITLFVVVVGFFMSCKKDKDTIPAPPPTPVVAGVLVKDGSARDKKVETPAVVRIGVYKYTGGSRDTSLQVFLNLGNTIPLIQMGNIKVTIKKNLVDSIVLSSPSAIVEGYWPNLISFKKNETATISVDVFFSEKILNKSIIPRLALRDVNASGQGMEYVAGQTTTFGYTSAASINSLAPATNQIVNGQRIELLSLEITASALDDNAVKQLSAQHIFADNGINDTLMFDSLRVFRAGNDITSVVTIVDAGGNEIHFLSELVATHNKFYVVYTSGAGEFVIPKGVTEKFTVTGIARGFRSGDGSSTTAIFDTGQLPANFLYLNKGTNGMHAKIFSSPTTTSGANQYIQNFVWSNMSGPSHSGIYSISSKDWFNSFGLEITVSANILNM